ncbi:MAG: DUF2726 domain-containing protein [Clostridia bacterium]|nr:DUF2726 domain-containing protein [Clostridia bacterium]
MIIISIIIIWIIIKQYKKHKDNNFFSTDLSSYMNKNEPETYNSINNTYITDNEIETDYTKQEIKKTINYDELYMKKNYLLTRTEANFYKTLNIITNDLNLVICPQVALYEIVRNKDFKDFNKIKSKSIDFVITDKDLRIILCIELDDYTHSRYNRIKRDDFINTLFKDLNINLLRISVSNKYDIDELKNKIVENM